jgi:hypothetical protein
MLKGDGRTDITEQPFGSKGEQTAYRRLYQDAHVGYRSLGGMRGTEREIRWQR